MKFDAYTGCASSWPPSLIAPWSRVRLTARAARVLSEPSWSGKSLVPRVVINHHESPLDYGSTIWNHWNTWFEILKLFIMKWFQMVWFSISQNRFEPWSSQRRSIKPLQNSTINEGAPSWGYPVVLRFKTHLWMVISTITGTHHWTDRT